MTGYGTPPKSAVSKDFRTCCLTARRLIATTCDTSRHRCLPRDAQHSLSQRNREPLKMVVLSATSLSYLYTTYLHSLAPSLPPSSSAGSGLPVSQRAFQVQAAPTTHVNQGPEATHKHKPYLVTNEAKFRMCCTCGTSSIAALYSDRVLCARLTCLVSQAGDPHCTRRDQCVQTSSPCPRAQQQQRLNGGQTTSLMSTLLLATRAVPVAAL